MMHVNQKNLSKKLKNLLQEVRSSVLSNSKTAIELCSEGLELTKNQSEFISDRIHFLLLKGYGYYVLNDQAIAHQLYREAVYLSTEIQDNHLLSQSYIRLAATMMETSSHEEVFNMLEKAKSIDPNYPRFEYYKTIAVAYFHTSQHEKSIYFSRESLNFVETNSSDQALIYTNLGESFLVIKKFAESLEYYHKALEIALALQLPKIFIFSYIGIAANHSELQEYDKAQEFHQKALNLVKIHGFEGLIAGCNYAFAKVHFAQGNYKEAEKALLHVLDLPNADFNTLKDSKKLLIETYERLHETDKAQKVWTDLANFLEQEILNLNTSKQIQNLEAKEKEINTLIANRNLIEEKNTKLEQQNADLLQFSFISAHDLKEPVRNIGSFSNLLERRYWDQLPIDAREFINVIRTNSHKINKQLDNLIQYTWIDNGNHACGLTDFRVILEESILPMEELLREQNAELIVENEDSQIFCNKQLIKIAVTQFIKNAIRFRSTAPLVISISCHVSDKEAIISVKDNGIGIAKEYHDKIFKIFKRLDKTQEGTGIGLAFVKKIAQKHNGRTWLDSAPGSGSNFQLALPY